MASPLDATSPQRLGAGGGRTVVQPHFRPRALLFAVLSVLWVFPSAGAAFIILSSPEWLRAGGLLAGLQAVRMEQWIALGVLLAHPVFVWQAVQLRREEVRREAKVRVPNPEDDPHGPR
jgi:hypothetical protein